MEEIIETLKELGIKIGAIKERYVTCHCPYHDDAHPSFAIYEDEGFVCWGCGAWGTITKLINDFATGITKHRRIAKTKKAKRKPRPKVEAPAPAPTYLTEYYLLFFSSCPKSWYKSRNLTVGTVDKFELRYDVYSDRIVFPVREEGEYERLVGMVGRLRDDRLSGVKYENMLGIKTGNHLYGLTNEVIENYNEIIIVEGPMDVCNMWEKGFKNVVGTFTSSVSKIQAEKLGKNFDNFVVFYDKDKAGEKGVRKCFYELLKFGRVYLMEHFEGKKEGADPENYSIDELNLIYGNREIFVM